jgi:hypothetical protein
VEELSGILWPMAGGLKFHSESRSEHIKKMHILHRVGEPFPP